MKKKRTVFIIIGLFLIGVLYFWFTDWRSYGQVGAWERFGDCITEEGAKMYVYECPRVDTCGSYSMYFGGNFTHNGIVECEKEALWSNPELCKEIGFNTPLGRLWVFNDNSRTSEALTAEQLSEKTGCKLPRTTAPWDTLD